MNRIKMDKRTKEDLVESVRELAKTYTPEWRLDEEYPDVGTALALIYADMLAGTIHRYNQIPKKNEMAFFQQIHTKQLPARPSSGYVTFHLVNHEVEGVEVPTGTGILAKGEDGGEVRLETRENVYVSPAKINCLYHTSDSHDEIRQVYADGEGFTKDAPNQQSHEWYFAREDAFQIETDAWIKLHFQPYPWEGEHVEFSYSSKQGFLPFASRTMEAGGVSLYKGREQEPFAKMRVNGMENHWVRCQTIPGKPFPSFTFDRMSIHVRSGEFEPELIIAAGLECAPEEYLPFGERFSRFTEVYFASTQAFGKKGAKVTLRFKLDFLKVPIREVEEEEVEYKWMMKRASVKKEKEYEISIREVQWEYYNGKGWSRLWKDSSHSDVFHYKGVRADFMKTISFTCPDDIEPILVESRESYYIRARVTKVDNEFKYNGHYLVPSLSHTSLSYVYPNEGVAPERMVTRNNMEWKWMRGEGGFRPFVQTGVDKTALYLCFSSPLTYGPLKYLFRIARHKGKKAHELRWECYEGGAFREMAVVDETKGFRKTGLLTFMGSKDHQKKSIFGKEGYWLRILDKTGRYDEERRGIYQSILGISPNSVKVEARRASKTERFGVGGEDGEVSLAESSLIHIELWVDESSADGKEDWVKWTEVDDFVCSNSLDRHYVVDRIGGRIRFGDGRNGRKPPHKGKDNVKVEYRSGGGLRTNLPRDAELRLERSFGFIHAVTNVEAIEGGKDYETLKDAVQRKAAAIRHRYRAVTERDYEELAMEASKNVGQARCFGNYDESGNQRPGYVTLVLLPREGEREPHRFEAIQNEVMDYMRDKVEAALLERGRLAIREPRYYSCDVYAVLLAASLESVFDVRRLAKEAIKEYFAGMGVGQLPTQMQLKGKLQQLKGVTLVKELKTTKAPKEDPYAFALEGKQGIEVLVDGGFGEA